MTRSGSPSPAPADGIVTGVAASPDRKHLAVATYDDPANTARLHLTDLNGSNSRVLSTSPYANSFRRLRFAPDGKRLAYVDGRGVGGRCRSWTSPLES